MIKTKTTLKKVVPASSNTFNGRITELEHKLTYYQTKLDKQQNKNTVLLNQILQALEVIQNHHVDATETHFNRLESKVDGYKELLYKIEQMQLTQAKEQQELEYKLNTIINNQTKIIAQSSNSHEETIKKYETSNNALINQLTYNIKRTLNANYQYNIAQLMDSKEILSDKGQDWVNHEAEKVLGEWYTSITGEAIDFRNPRTYNEKIQWSKLYDRNPLKTILADKYKVRAWVEAKIGSKYLIDIFGVYDNWDSIPFDELPNQFVIKATHGSAMNIIVKDKSKLDKVEGKKKVNGWLNTNFAYSAGMELQYKDMEPRIIVEQYIGSEETDLEEYKIYLFGGQTAYIIFASTDKNGNRHVTWFDKNWNKQAIKNLRSSPHDEEIAKPDNLSDIVKIAEILGQDFAHVRVDLYNTDKNTIKFGELTFSPNSGLRKYEPEDHGLTLGELFILPTLDGDE